MCKHGIIKEQQQHETSKLDKIIGWIEKVKAEDFLSTGIKVSKLINLSFSVHPPLQDVTNTGKRPMDSNSLSTQSSPPKKFASNATIQIQVPSKMSISTPSITPIQVPSKMTISTLSTTLTTPSPSNIKDI